LSVRMRNRKLQNICPNGAFSPEMTSSPIGIPLGCSLGRPRPISSMATGTSPYHYLPLLFSYNNMRQVQPETLPKNSIFSSCLQNIKLKIGRSMNMYYYGTSKSSTIWLPNRKKFKRKIT
jgi:hypothetical protein